MYSRPNVLILGNGYLGSYLYQELSKDDNLNVMMYSGGVQYKVDFLINCRGLVDVEACKLDPVKSLQLNCSDFINICDQVNPTNVINMSSYFVYDKNGDVFNTNYARHKNLADVYTKKLRNGSVLLLGKLFGKSPKQQYRFPEMCLEDKKLFCENITHPFTSLFDVLSFVKHIIYSGINIRTEIFTWCGSPLSFAKLCDHRQAIEIPKIDKFERYGEFLSTDNNSTSATSIIKFKKDMKC